jgi:hypothetical protein
MDNGVQIKGRPALSGLGATVAANPDSVEERGRSAANRRVAWPAPRVEVTSALIEGDHMCPHGRRPAVLRAGRTRSPPRGGGVRYGTRGRSTAVGERSSNSDAVCGILTGVGRLPARLRRPPWCIGVVLRPQSTTVRGSPGRRVERSSAARRCAVPLPRTKPHQTPSPPPAARPRGRGARTDRSPARCRGRAGRRPPGAPARCP